MITFTHHLSPHTVIINKFITLFDRLNCSQWNAYKERSEINRGLGQKMSKNAVQIQNKSPRMWWLKRNVKMNKSLDWDWFLFMLFCSTEHYNQSDMILLNLWMQWPIRVVYFSDCWKHQGFVCVARIWHAVSPQKCFIYSTNQH